MTQTLQLGGLEFEIRRSNRRKTLGLTVDRAGELIAHVPFSTSVPELRRWLENKLLWVHRKLALKESLLPQRQAPEFVTGETFCYLGRPYRLKIVAQQERPLEFDGTRFTLRRNALPAQAHFHRWYIQTGTAWLKQRVETLARRAGARPDGVEVRDIGYRWGSCGRNRVLYFNWKLLQLPVRLVDYVILHELIHLREGHHGPAFWAALERALPDYRSRRESLDRQAADYLRLGHAV